jgi:hypothetical protein
MTREEVLATSPERVLCATSAQTTRGRASRYRYFEGRAYRLTTDAKGRAIYKLDSGVLSQHTTKELVLRDLENSKEPGVICMDYGSLHNVRPVRNGT